MVLHGHVKGKIIEIDTPSVNLPDGTAVEIIPVPEKKDKDPFCGAWKDDRPAEEIIKDIRKARCNNRKEIAL